VLYLGARSQLSVGSLLVVMAYIAQMYQPLQLLSTKITDLQSWFVSLERACMLLHQPPEIAERPRPLGSRAQTELSILPCR
jgi:ATP-binding cassette, subfamily B, bacterial